MTKNTTIITAATLLLAGCGLGEDDNFDLPEGADPVEASAPAGEIAANPGEAIPASDPLTYLDKECFGAPVIGILNDYNTGDCKLDGGLPEDWSGVSLFAEGSPQTQGLGLSVPGQLNAYCRYEYSGASDWHTAYDALLESIEDYGEMPLESLSADCLAYGPMAGLDDQTVVDALEQAFTLNIDNQQELFAKAEYETVHMAMLDTVDQQGWLGGTDPGNLHGLQMRGLAEGIACPDSIPHCEETLTQVLVTPRDREYRPDWSAGDELGVLSDFSLGVYVAVQKWREEQLGQNRHERLILNASVGADFQAILAADISHGSMASAVAVLNMAACYGVIVVASAGNVRDESCPAGEDGMLAPAIFESIMMPDLDTCVALGYEPDWDLGKWPVFPPPGVDRPLVYGVGGVDGFDDEINNARGASAPRIVATAANAISPGGDTPLTGTSVGSVVVAATAKLGWGLDPSLRPDELMEAIYSSGYDIGRPAEDGNWAFAENQRRVSVCAALDAVSGGGFGCEARAPDASGNIGGFADATGDIVDDPGTLLKEHDDGGNLHAPICDATPLSEVLTPQPEIPACAYCTAGIDAGAGSNNDFVLVDIDAYYQGIPSDPDDMIVGIKLILDVGKELTFKAHVVDAIRDDPTTEVHVVYFHAPAGVTKAALQFELADGDTQTNTIPVVNVAT